MLTGRLPTLSEPQLERINTLAARAFVALLTLALAYTLAQLTWRLLAPPPAPELLATGSEKARPVRAAPRADHAARIVNAHLFGKAESANPVAAAPAEVPETRLNLTLRGVLAAPGDQAFALIASGSGPESLYQVGDPLPGGARLKEVLADRVVLERNGQLETLKLPREEMPGFAASPADTPAVFPATSPRRPRVPASAAAIRERAVSRTLARLKQTALRNPQALARLISATPVEEEGRLLGYRVNPGSNHRLFSQLGLQPGDVVTAVNGIALSDPNDVLSVLQVLHDADQISITVQRNGSETTLTHRIGTPDGEG